MILFVAFIAVTFIARLFYLQVLSPNYQERAKRNAYYNKAIYPARGIIFDRNGNLLVANKPAYDLMVTMSEVSKDLDTLSLARVLSVSVEELRLSLQKVKDRKINRGYSPYTPQILMSNFIEILI